MMQALQLDGQETPPRLHIDQVSVPEPGSQEVRVRVKAAALNHRDQWIREGKYPGIKPGRTLGSDACGVVEAVGIQDNEHWIGKEVIINPNINWGDNPDHQGDSYHILGNPSNGTFADYIVVNIDRLHPKPAHLGIQEAAALPLGGLTAYRAVFTKGRITAEDTVLINGVGGGVAQFAFQFALAVGAKVFVTSGSEAKLRAAMKMGAAGCANYKHDDWYKTLKNESGGFTCAIDSAGGASLNYLIKLMRHNGRIVCYGATLGRPESIDIHRIFYYQLQLLGSTMGNDEEFKQMLDFVEKHRLKPIIDTIMPFSAAITAFDRMKKGNHFGKIVLQISNDSVVGKLRQKLSGWVQKTVGR